MLNNLNLDESQTERLIYTGCNTTIKTLNVHILDRLNACIDLRNIGIVYKNKLIPNEYPHTFIYNHKYDDIESDSDDEEYQELIIPPTVTHLCLEDCFRYSKIPPSVTHLRDACMRGEIPSSVTHLMLRSSRFNEITKKKAKKYKHLPSYKHLKNVTNLIFYTSCKHKEYIKSTPRFFVTEFNIFQF